MKNYLPIVILIVFACSCKKEIQLTDRQTGGGIHDTGATGVAANGPVTSADFKGVNWADPRDNFADDALVLSGLTAGDNHGAVTSKATKILKDFQDAGANTVRLPINPSTALTNWWFSYKGAIDKASERGMKVLLGYWEGASSKDGRVDDPASFWQMWDTVVTTYQNNPNIYFEVFNEPHGYTAADLETLYASFLDRYPNISRERIVLDGVGYATDVNSVGNDSRFSNCLLSFHFYTWFSNGSQITADWERTIRGLWYPTRTIVTEFGVPMTNGKAYLSAPGNDREVTYLQGMTNAIHDLGLGGIYWPGLREGDSYAMFSFDGKDLTVNNPSGLARLQYAWNDTVLTQPYGTFNTGTYYKVINKNSNKSLDVNGGSTSDGGNIIQWDYWGGNNQQWSLSASSNSGYFSITNHNSNKVLDVNEQATNAGAGIVQWSYSGGASQQWQVVDQGFGYYKIINRNSGLALDVNGQSKANGGNIIQWYYNSGNNQVWQIATP